MIIGSGRIEDLAPQLADATGEDGDSDRAGYRRAVIAHCHARDVEHCRAALDKFLAAVAGSPVLDNRSPDEIIGYGPDITGRTGCLNRGLRYGGV